jgi:hypothetical protein
VSPVPYLDRWLLEAASSVRAVSSAPIASREALLRGDRTSEVSPGRVLSTDTAVGRTAPAAKGALGPLETIAAQRPAAPLGLFVIAAVGAWWIRHRRLVAVRRSR